MHTRTYHLLKTHQNTKEACTNICQYFCFVSKRENTLLKKILKKKEVKTPLYAPLIFKGFQHPLLLNNNVI